MALANCSSLRFPSSMVSAESLGLPFGVLLRILTYCCSGCGSTWSRDLLAFDFEPCFAHGKELIALLFEDIARLPGSSEQDVTADDVIEMIQRLGDLAAIGKIDRALKLADRNEGMIQFRVQRWISCLE